MAKVKGTKITSKLAFVKDELGEEAETRVLEALSEEDREAVRTALGLGWYSHELYERVIRAVVDAGAGGDERVLDRMGAHTAEVQSRGAYGVYFRAKDPQGLLESMVPMHSMLNDPGEMALEPQGEGHLSILVRQPEGTPQVCRLSRAFYRRAVELCGARDVTVRELECSGSGAPACRFEVRWTGGAGRGPTAA